MQAKLQFLGAAQNVTGSCHLLEADGTRILIDCGLYQERQLKIRNWDPFPMSPRSIDAVLLTHAHLDHCGLLPKLVRDGFKGKVYCTDATAELARIILLDAAHLQEEDAAFKRKRHRRERRKGPYPEVPLYTAAEAEACCPWFSPVKYKQPITIGGAMEAIFYDAGHILGSSIIRVKVGVNSRQRTVLFSGDIGRPHRPIIRDPTIFEQADYVLVESTYGDRLHQDVGETKKMVADVINSAVKDRGNIIVPSFALERSQEILYYINQLLLEGAIPKLPVFLDSPMASSITKVFQHHAELFDEEMTEFLKLDESPFSFPGLKMTETTKESKAINKIKKTVMVIAGSGMCTGGRIKHHLVNNITRPESTIMFVGFQALGTLGRQIVDGQNEVRIFGQKYPVKARVVQIHGFSAHADRDELLQWLNGLKRPPKKLFVIHGEPESAHHFGDYVKEKTGWDVTVPTYQDQFLLD